MIISSFPRIFTLQQSLIFGEVTAKLTTVMNTNETNSPKSYDAIKLGIDAHSKWYYVARPLDGATPKPVRKIELDGLLHFVAKQQNLADEVHTLLARIDHRSGFNGGSGI